MCIHKIGFAAYGEGTRSFTDSGTISLIDFDVLPELATEYQLADFLDVRPSTLRKWRIRGSGPAFIKIGKRNVRYPRAAVELWLKTQQGGKR